MEMNNLSPFLADRVQGVWPLISDQSPTSLAQVPGRAVVLHGRWPPWCGIVGYAMVGLGNVSVLGGEEGYTAKYGLNPREFPRAQPEGPPEGSGHILPYIPSRVLIRTLYHFLK